ncbi:3740_t:CDS:2, partial [Acaulospora colombiana]
EATIRSLGINSGWRGHQTTPTPRTFLHFCPRTMSTKPVITVFLATGKTGGGTIDAILADGTYAARAVTRNPNSDAAKGKVQYNTAYLSPNCRLKLSLLEVLRPMLKYDKSVEGAYGVLGATDFWSSFMDEEKQGQNLVNAAKKAGVKHFIWVTLDHSGVPHFEQILGYGEPLASPPVCRTPN